MPSTAECTRCATKYPLTAKYFRPRPDSTTGFRKVCRSCHHSQTWHAQRERQETLGRSSAVAKGDVKSDKVDPGPQPVAHRLANSQAKVFVVTYAQNATPVHPGVLTALHAYCEHRLAELIVIAGRYHNPTSVWSRKMQHQDWWDKELHPWLFQGRALIANRVQIVGDMSIQPTAVRPLSGLEVFSGEYNCIFGHPRLQMITVATGQRRYPRILQTTGACTIRNYVPAKAGKKAAAHHVFGATVIERDGPLCHIRNLNAMADGSFMDLPAGLAVSATGEITPAPRASALICGDIHVDCSDEEVLDATFRASDSVVQVTRPERIIFHDTLDFRRRNRHDVGKFTKRYAQATGALPEDVRAEVEESVEFIDEMTPEDSLAIVVSSNHDDAFDRWLETADHKQDPVNAKFYLESWLMKLQHFEEHGEWQPAFEAWYKELGDGRARFLRLNESYRVHDIELGFHGHNGLNGTRGSSLQYTKLGVKCVVAHHHSPSILDGVYTVGITGKLDQGYNSLPSAWMNSHVLVAPNGKRQMIHVLNGRWSAHRVAASSPTKPVQSVQPVRGHKHTPRRTVSK